MFRTAARKTAAFTLSICLLMISVCGVSTDAAADSVKPVLISLTTASPAYSDGQLIEFIVKFFDASGVDISKLGMVANLTDSTNRYGTRVVLMEFLSTDISSKSTLQQSRLRGMKLIRAKFQWTQISRPVNTISRSSLFRIMHRIRQHFSVSHLSIIWTD